MPWVARHFCIREEDSGKPRHDNDGLPMGFRHFAANAALTFSGVAGRLYTLAPQA